MRSIIIVIFLCIIASKGGAQNIEWQKTIGGTGTDQCYSILITPDGGSLLSGYSDSDASGDKNEDSYGDHDYWIVKLDKFQNIEWQKTFGGNAIDFLKSAGNTADFGFILGGYSNSDLSGNKNENSYMGSDDYWILKLDSHGEIIWQKTIGGNDSDWLNSIIQTNDGGFLAAGGTQSFVSGDITTDGYGGEDYWIVKLSANGEIEWQKRYGGSESDEAHMAEQTEDGGYIICGISNSDISGVKSDNSFMGSDDVWIIKIDSEGTIEWQKTIGGNNYEMDAKIKTFVSDGYLIGVSSLSGISGVKSEENRGSTDYWIIKIDLQGNIVWQKTIGGNSLDYLTSLSVRPDQSILVGGWSKSTISNEKTIESIGENDYWVLNLEKTGEIENQGVYGGTEGDFLYSIDQDNDGYLLAGSSVSGVSGNKTDNSQGASDFWLLRIEDLVINSIEDTEKTIKLFPNPTSGILNIGNSESNQISIEIFNIKGEKVKKYQGNENSLSIDISDLSFGVYFLQLKVDDKKYSFKVIKK